MEIEGYDPKAFQRTIKEVMPGVQKAIKGLEGEYRRTGRQLLRLWVTLCGDSSQPLPLCIDGREYRRRQRRRTKRKQRR